MRSTLAGTPESIRVLDWREEQFLRLGFPPVQAHVLAASRADPHEAAALLARGCSRKTAAKILL